MPYFVRAKPSKIEVTESYRYKAVISGNPSIDEDGEPDGTIHVQLPLDGFRWFTRDAYLDYLEQRTNRRHLQIPSGPASDQIRIGYLVMTGIKPEELWPQEPWLVGTQARFDLDFPVPQPEEQLIEDGLKVNWRHDYQPAKPNVDPRPYPLSFQVDIYDERSLYDRVGNKPEGHDWVNFLKEITYEESLLFDFQLEVVAPQSLFDPLKNHPPILKWMQFGRPLATSHQNLRLWIKPQNGKMDYRDWYNQSFLYSPDDESVEWRDIEFRLVDRADNDPYLAGQNNQHLPCWQLPALVLEVRNPGEFYNHRDLQFELEVELPGVLLSGAKPEYFNARGVHMPIKNGMKLCTNLHMAGRVDFRQRFQNRTLSPYQQLQFEGVIPDDGRIRDITALLQDKGFEFSIKESQVSKNPDEGNVIVAFRSDGPDSIRIYMYVTGTQRETERETTISGGQKYTSALPRGNLVLEMRAELRGDIRKLTQLMNALHRELKERFYHVSTLE